MKSQRPAKEETKVNEQKPIGISAEIIAKLESTAEKLIHDRKQTKPPSDYTSKKEIGKFKLSKTYNVPSNVKSFDAVEDVIILATQTNNSLYALDFDGQQLFESAGSGNAKFLPFQTDKIF